MRKIVFSFLVLAFLTSSHEVSAQTIASKAPPDPTVNYDRLSRMDGLIQGYIDKGWLNGMFVLVVKDNQVVKYKAFGYADLESKKPMAPDALFRLASQTKAIVSAGILTLWEEGKFSLDEPISDFIPAFAHPKVMDKFNPADSSYTTIPAKREITFRDLLTHTSGLDYPGIGSERMRAIYEKAGIPSGLGNIDRDLNERMNALARLPLAHQPGEKWTYGLSVDLLGCLIEIISGKDLETFLHDRIFAPLGMHDTYFNVPASKAGRLATVYTEDSLHHVIRWASNHFGIDPAYPLQPKHYFSGGAGLTGSAFDYAVFLQMLLNGGRYNGVQVLAPRTVQLMTSGQLDFMFNGRDNFGLGFGVTSEKSATREPRNAGSFSWGGYFGTTYWADPKAKMVVLIMTQQTPNSHGELTGRVEQLIYQSLK
ncbi:MAG: serine hydrolase domain-containing protein [Bacteroidota bacterium]|nr:serine hydrolase domain-containing protein [Bacteroidota bacterium]